MLAMFSPPHYEQHPLEDCLELVLQIVAGSISTRYVAVLVSTEPHDPQVGSPHSTMYLRNFTNALCRFNVYWGSFMIQSVQQGTENREDLREEPLVPVWLLIKGEG